jgi:hypothetical protein
LLEGSPLDAVGQSQLRGQGDIVIVDLSPPFEGSLGGRLSE